MELIEKAIRWFENIAYECDKLTSGNVAHLKAQIKGMAIRSAEYLTKHSQEPAKWSAEDEEIIEFIEALCDDKDRLSPYDDVKEITDKIRAWLKSLRPQNQWKPSEEQMDALNAMFILPHEI